ncbi:MAG: hypothetical protein PUG84_01520 [Peptoniphilaceae bacterium]|nr:hypothetical protein [Peptoniphilaceae bacterium]
MKYIRENFNSIQEMLNALKIRKNNSVMSDKFQSQSTDNSNWYRTNSYEEAEHLITNGYIDILDKIKKGIKFKSTENSKTMPENNVFGYIPNVPNAIMNLPKSMVYEKRVPRKINTIDLVYSPCAPGVTDSKEYIENGIKVLNIINSLELNNIRISLKVAMKCSSCNNEFTLATVTIKNYTEKLNLQKICFPIAHPSMQRRFGFKWLETHPDVNSFGWANGYGSTSTEYPKTNSKEIIFGLTQIRNLNEEEIINKFIIKER